jgi:hypothetical protein
VVLLLTGCAPREVIHVQRPAQHATVYRFTSAPTECPKPVATNDVELRRVTKSRDDWKRYADYLETLLPPDTNHGTHP